MPGGDWECGDSAALCAGVRLSATVPARKRTQSRRLTTIGAAGSQGSRLSALRLPLPPHRVEVGVHHTDAFPSDPAKLTSNFQGPFNSPLVYLDVSKHLTFSFEPAPPDSSLPSPKPVGAILDVSLSLLPVWSEGMRLKLSDGRCRGSPTPLLCLAIPLDLLFLKTSLVGDVQSTWRGRKTAPLLPQPHQNYS